MDFKEFMNEEQTTNRWAAVRIALFGTFVGALLMIMFALLGIIG